MRARDLTSTEIAALFDASPYVTKYELWHRKRSEQVVEIEPNERMVWGNRLEPAIAQGIAQDEGWEISRATEYIRDETRRLGASFDYWVGNPKRALLEVKNIDGLAFRDGWIVVDDEVEAPVHIELQVQQQLMLSELEEGYIGGLVAGNRKTLLRRKPDPAVQERIVEKAHDFWLSIAENRPPEPDLNRDADFIAEMMAQCHPGTLFDARGRDDIRAHAAAYRFHADMERQACAAKEAAKTAILLAVGEAAKVQGDDYTISLGTVAGGTVSYERKPYRNFRLSFRKETA